MMLTLTKTSTQMSIRGIVHRDRGIYFTEVVHIQGNHIFVSITSSQTCKLKQSWLHYKRNIIPIITKTQQQRLLSNSTESTKMTVKIKNKGTCTATKPSFLFESFREASSRVAFVQLAAAHFSLPVKDGFALVYWSAAVTSSNHCLSASLIVSGKALTSRRMT